MCQGRAGSERIAEGQPGKKIAEVSVSTIGSVNYNLAKEMTRILNPLTGTTPSHILNSTHFVQLSRNVKLDDEDLMVSFDVCSLFTKVPIDEAMLIVAKKLEEDESLGDRTSLTPSSICQLTELCLQTTYFQQNGKLWEQCDGAAMGSPLSPVVANLYMEAFEQEAIERALDKPKLWVRYVDNTFVIWQHGQDKLESFLELLNNMRDPIKFTIEIEQNGQLPFMDVLVEKGGEQLTTSVYRKHTHTD